MAITPALHAELRHAARTIIATKRPTPGTLAAAHDTLTQRRHDTTGDIRTAIDHYLDNNTWHHGPTTLRRAAHQLAAVLGIQPPELPHLTWHQPQLFDPDNR